MYAARVGLRGMSDPHSNWSDTGAGVGVGPMVSDGLAGGGSSTPVVPPPVGGAFPYNNTVHQTHWGEDNPSSHGLGSSRPAESSTVCYLQQSF